MALRIKPGDRVSILGGDSRTVVTGTVLTAHNYGEELTPDWYIELNQDGFGYIYWKQAIDGGSVQKLSKPRLTVFDHVNHSGDNELVTDAVYETCCYVLEIPGVREAVTVAMMKHWGDWQLKDLHSHVDDSELRNLPLQWLYQWLTNADENDEESES